MNTSINLVANVCNYKRSSLVDPFNYRGKTTKFKRSTVLLPCRCFLERIYEGENSDFDQNHNIAISNPLLRLEQLGTRWFGLIIDLDSLLVEASNIYSQDAWMKLAQKKKLRYPSKYDLKVEIGGGVRSLDNVKQYIDAGVDKVILGSGAIKNKEFLKEACENFKDQIALGLDAKDGNLSVSGWKENLNIKTIDFLKEVNNYGVSRIIYTDINRDGMKISPNFDETVKITELSNCPVVISGGVSSLNDIKKAKELNNKKIEGIIVGKAIYDGDIKLDELAKEISA